jgi:lipoic acid synthetase
VIPVQEDVLFAQSKQVEIQILLIQMNLKMVVISSLSSLTRLLLIVSQAIADWGLDYVVLTSVDRDDLPDQGSAHFARTVQLLKQKHSDILVECLTPDFRGNADFILTVARSGLDVYAHNIETVERLQRRVRDYRAGYRQSISVLELVKQKTEKIITKTSIMLGLGETSEDIRQTMTDLRTAGVDVLTFGQYLRPTKRHMSVQRYVTPEEFQQWHDEAVKMEFKYVASGPLVRSSYKAGELYLKGMINKEKEKEIAIGNSNQ